MKKFFRTVTALTLVCGAFAFTGCTDYEEDINSINNRLDELTTGQIASIEEQVGSLSDAIDEADGLISALQGDVDALETAKTTIEGQIKTLNDNIGTINGNISDINGKISGLETDLEKQIADAKAELEKADQANADRIDKLVSDLDQAKKDLQSEIEKGDKANADAIASLATTVSDNYSALKKAIDDANTSNKAEFDKIYGEIETLKTDLKTQTDALADLTSTVADLSGKVAALETLTAGLPELEKTVADIKENYLSKAEAADIYATAESVLKLQEELGKVSGRLEVIEDLDIAERLSSLESNYENLTDIVIPNLNDAVVKAQSAAEKAQTSAKEAMTYAQSVFGELESLERSLEVYANDIEGRFNELSAMDAALSDRADALMEFVSDLNSTVSAEIIALRSNIASVQTILDQAVKDLESSKLDKTEFSEYFSQALMDDILKANGQVNTAINQKLAEATKNLQSSIDAVDKRIDSEVMPAINNLKERIDAVEDIVQDLANRIQSLVYVPEYSDGKATVSVYEINGKPVSEDVVVSATFKVTPAAVAEAVVNQYKDYAIAYVNDVKNPDTRAASAGTPIFGDDLKITRNASDPSYIDVEVTVPAEYNVRDERNDGFAFSLYVASKEEVNLVKEGGELLLDAGTYVSSDYVQTAVSVKELKDAYVLYNEVAGKEYPAGDSEETQVDEVNWYERAWSYSAEDPNDRFVYFYGDNTLSTAEDQSEKGSYTLHIKLDDEYLTLDEAADVFRTDEESITPEYAAVEVKYYDRNNVENEDLAENFKVDTEAEPYGTSVDMTKTNELASLAGMYVQVTNTFAFGKDNKYEYSEPLITNVTRYTVINEPIVLTLDPSSIDWTYDWALEHSDDAVNPTKPNVQPINLEKHSFKATKLGGNPLATILAWGKLIKDESYVVVNGEKLAVDAEGVPVLDIRGANNAFLDGEHLKVNDTYDGGTMFANVSGYNFSDKGATTYEFVYKYNLESMRTICEVRYTMTLGQMPGSASYNYTFDPEKDKIKFMLPGSGEIDYVGTERGVVDAFNAMYGVIANDEFKWFGNADLTPAGQFKEALEVDAANRTFYTTKRDGEVVEYYEDAINDAANSRPVWSRLNLSMTDESPAESTSYIRVSSSQVTSIENEFEFTTVVKTWFGPEYTFNAKLGVDDPDYKLGYINTHIDFDAETPFVTLDYAEVGGENGVAYQINESHPRNYFNVTGAAGSSAYLQVKIAYEVPENDPSYGTLPEDGLSFTVNNNSGELVENYIIPWASYNARDLNLTATLVAKSSASATEEIVINTLPLEIVVPGLVKSFNSKAGDEVNVFERENTGIKVTINLWEYLDAIAAEAYGDSENFIPTEFEGQNITTLVNVNNHPDMKLYGARITFGKINVVSGGQLRPDLQDSEHYNAETGTFTYRPEDGTIVSPIEITVDATLNYYLDYNGNTERPLGSDQGAIKIPLKLQIIDKK